MLCAKAMDPRVEPAGDGVGWRAAEQSNLGTEVLGSAVLWDSALEVSPEAPVCLNPDRDFRKKPAENLSKDKTQKRP